MLSFLKSKPKLSDLIPSGYVDIHSHILPGIDDGAKTLEDTEFLLEEMKQLGFTKVITTPHTMSTVWENTPETIQNASIKVKSELSLPFEIQAASEYLLDESVITKAKNKELLTLKNNFVLVEFSYLNPPIQLYDFLYQLQLSGYYGKEVAETANYLLKENLYDFTGSDIHHKNHIAAFQSKLVFNNGDKIKEVMKKNTFFL